MTGSAFHNPLGQSLNASVGTTGHTVNYPISQHVGMLGQTVNNPIGQTMNNPLGMLGQTVNNPIGQTMNNPVGMLGQTVHKPMGHTMNTSVGTGFNNNMGIPYMNQTQNTLPNNMSFAQPRMPSQVHGVFNQNSALHQQNPIMRKQKEPDTFDGKTTDWVDYIIQFEKVANWNGWDPYERAQQLIMSLRGIAQRTVSELNPYQLNDFEFIKRMLSQRFNPIERETAHKFEFKNRRKQKDESVSDYGHALRRLASQAYPSLDLPSIEALVVDQFVEGIGNRDLKRYVTLLNRPRTLDQAISYAIEYEAFEGPIESIRKPQFSDEVTYHTYVVDQTKQTENINLEEKIKNIIIQELKNENHKPPIKESVNKNSDENTFVKPVDGNYKKRSVIICDYCGRKGHIQTRCFKQKEDELTRMREELANAKNSDSGE